MCSLAAEVLIIPLFLNFSNSSTVSGDWSNLPTDYQIITLFLHPQIKLKLMKQIFTFLVVVFSATQLFSQTDSTHQDTVRFTFAHPSQYTDTATGEKYFQFDILVSVDSGIYFSEADFYMNYDPFAFVYSQDSIIITRGPSFDNLTYANPQHLPFPLFPRNRFPYPL